MREFVLFVDAERYIATLSGKKHGEMASESEKQKTRKALRDFELILMEYGRTWPNESDYSEYRAGKPDNKTTQQNVSRIKRYFAWREKENNKHMEEYVQQDLFTENEAKALPENEAETLGAVEAITSEPLKTRKNRKRNGEKRVQVSMYLKPETYEGIRLMSANMNQTINDILEVFAEKFVELNQEAIQRMKSTWSEVKVRFK